MKKKTAKIKCLHSRKISDYYNTDQNYFYISITQPLNRFSSGGIKRYKYGIYFYFCDI